MDIASNQSDIVRDSGPDSSSHARNRGQKQQVKHTRGIGIVIVLLIVLAAVIFFPWYAWKSAPELELKLAVVDKTVPFEDRREHRGLFWLFGQNKFVDSGKGDGQKFYDFREDYVGYDPNYAPNPLQPNQIPDYEIDLLDYGDLDDRDVLYLADTYGVYEADYYQFDEEFAHTRHSKTIFGGMTEGEVAAAELFAAEGKMIIAEFNTFASPTPKALAERIEALLGISWTRWLGRYFTDFGKVEDVPEWLYELYDESEEWEKRGRVDLIDEEDQAFVLVHDESQDFIFLWKDEDIEGDHAVTFKPVEKYMDGDMMQGTKSSPVNYWIELLEQGSDTEVMAQYWFNLKQTGKDKMFAHDLRLFWPAMTRYRPVATNHTAYYLVGDMSDFDKAMGSPNTRLTLFINRSYYGKKAKIGSQEYVFWNGYYPFLCNILRSESKRLHGEPQNVFLFNN